jgi:hypothetical protein
MDADYTLQANFAWDGVKAPSVSTYAATDVQEASAVLNGYIDDTGGEACECRFRYWQHGKPETSTAWTAANQSGFFGQRVTGLASESTYSFVAEARNSAGTAGGQTQTFKTPPSAAALSALTLDATQIAQHTAVLQGEVTGGESCEARFVYWREGWDPNQGRISTRWEPAAGTDTAVERKIVLLDPNTAYTYLVQARDSAGTADGQTTTFRTTPVIGASAGTLTIGFAREKGPPFASTDSYYENQVVIDLTDGQGVSDGLDSLDVIRVLKSVFGDRDTAHAPQIASNILESGNAYQLSTDRRTVSSTVAEIELGIFNSSLPKRVSYPFKNELRFYCDDPNAFGGQTLVIQKQSQDSNGCPCWDIGNLIAVSKTGIGVIREPNFVMDGTIIKKNYLPLSKWRLQIGRSPLDIDDSGRVDANDLALVVANLGRTGPNRADVASLQPNPNDPAQEIPVVGIPDGVVDSTDETAIRQAIAAASAKRVPSVDAATATDVTGTKATLQARLESDGGEACQYRFTYWPENDLVAKVSTEWECCATTGQTFSKEVSGLERDCTYGFAAEARNSVATATASGSFVTRVREGRLIIENARAAPEGFDAPSSANASFEFARVATTGVSEGLDASDVLYTGFKTRSSIEPKITSRLIDASGKSYDLEIDRRPEDGNTPVQVMLAIVSPLNISITPNHLANELRLSFPDTTLTFGDSLLTLQQFFPESTAGYPVYDVRKVIGFGQSGVGRISMPNLETKFTKKITYAGFQLRTDASETDLVDFNGDGVVDASDRAALVLQIGKTGPNRMDIASWQQDPNYPNDPTKKTLVVGIPDGAVTADADLAAMDRAIAEQQARHGR